MAVSKDEAIERENALISPNDERERGAVADLYDDLESQPLPDRSRLERFLLFALTIVLAYAGLAYLALAGAVDRITSTRRASPICRW